MDERDKPSNLSGLVAPYGRKIYEILQTNATQAFKLFGDIRPTLTSGILKSDPDSNTGHIAAISAVKGDDNQISLSVSPTSRGTLTLKGGEAVAFGGTGGKVNGATVPKGKKWKFKSMVAYWAQTATCTQLVLSIKSPEGLILNYITEATPTPLKHYVLTETDVGSITLPAEWQIRAVWTITADTSGSSTVRILVEEYDI